MTAQARLNPLAPLLRDLILEEGPLSLARYMELCLGHPDHGYYMTRDPLGAQGDFTTAPEISQIFGELIGLFFAEAWFALGQPAKVSLLELGPGRGTLMADLLRAANAVPGFRASLSVTMVDRSPPLVATQQRLMAPLMAQGIDVRWASALDDALAAEGDTPLFLIGNEFLDALPILQYERRDTGWHERRVGWADGALRLMLAPEAEPALKQHAPVATVRELSPAVLQHMVTVGAALAQRRGVALFIDYGFGAADPHPGATFQAMKGHAFADPFATPGEADLTAHVNFAAAAQAAERAGAVVLPLLTQAAFLERLGGAIRADALARRQKDQDKRQALLDGYARLVDRATGGMGDLFKVLALTGPGQPTPPGWADPT